MTKTIAQIAVAGMLLASLPGCSKGPESAPKAEVPASPERAAGIETRFPIKVGDKVVRAQFALRPSELQRGLMERQKLEEDEGMLFVFTHPQKMSFWMRNTPLPLDIGYFDSAGVLREVYPLFPYDEKPVASVSDRLHYALEMRQGWFRDHGVKPGAKLDLAELRAAIVARGMTPGQFSIPAAGGASGEAR